MAPCLALLLLLGAPPALGEPVGFLAQVQGTVEVRSSGATSWQAAALDRGVEVGDTVRTGPASYARILLVDDTTVSVDEETELVLDEFILGDLATQERSILRQLRGQMLIDVGETFGGTTRLEVHTPTAVVGVKGTRFETRVEDHTLVCNHEGRVFVRNVNAAFGGQQLIPEGMCRQVYRGLAPEEPEPFPPDFESIGRGPASEVPVASTDALLFGPPQPGVDLFEWVGDTAAPDVAAGPEDVIYETTGDSVTEPAREDPVDSARATGDIPAPPSGGAPEIPDISIGGGEAPGEK